MIETFNLKIVIEQFKEIDMKPNRTIQIDHIKNVLENNLDIFSEIYDFEHYSSNFCYLNYHMNENDSSHNCIACNLNETLSYTLDSIRNTPSYAYVEHYYCFVIQSLYLTAERVLSVSKSAFQIDEIVDSYPTTMQIRKWANFFKHPKSFLFCHHPDYFIDGFDNDDLENYDLIIDSTFIEVYYKDGSKNQELKENLENKQNVAVIFPKIDRLFKDFHVELNLFLNDLNDNPELVEELINRATIEDYFEN